MALTSAKGLHVIVGLGATGLSCAHHLKNLAIPFAIMDTRLNPPNLSEFKKAYPDATVSLGNWDVALLNKAECIVLSPGIALREPVINEQIKRGIPVIGDIELFAQAVKAPVIAITGTNAKSTVTTLVGLMAEAAGHQVQVGGNLGIPALDLLANNPKASLFVLELSSFQLETTYSLHSRVATVLNVTPDHMDRYETLADYQQAKARVYQHCEVAVCNRDDPLTECPSSINKKSYFTLDAPRADEWGLINQNGQTFLAQGKQIILATADLPVAGKHYQANALASLALGHAFGFPLTSMVYVLKTFKGLPHRCQLVREYQGVKWYNDSKGTNVVATQAAIEGLGATLATGKLVLIAGGVGKNADFTTLVPAIEKYSRHVVLIGEAAAEIAKAIGSRVPVSFAATLDEAVNQAADAAHIQDSVLLSPACASFDMFKNYEHRGCVFTDIVEKL